MQAKKHFIPFFFVLIFVALLTGCSSQTENTLTPEEIVQKSAERMKAANGFKFIFDREGAPAFLDVNRTISLTKMEGIYAAPDKVKASVRVNLPGLIAEVKIVSIGADQWQTNFCHRGLGKTTGRLGL